MGDVESVLAFWFDELTPGDWFRQDAELDERIRVCFSDLHAQASAGELAAWREHPRGRLAEIIVLDQFSRNLHRDSPDAFRNDTLALVLAQEAIRIRADEQLPVEQRCFLYMPYMHSESRVIHETALELFTRTGRPENIEFEIRHKNVIDRFGRYPHRNEVLGRTSTAEELAFLRENGTGF